MLGLLVWVLIIFAVFVFLIKNWRIAIGALLALYVLVSIGQGWRDGEIQQVLKQGGATLYAVEYKDHWGKPQRGWCAIIPRTAWREIPHGQFNDPFQVIERFLERTMQTDAVWCGGRWDVGQNTETSWCHETLTYFCNELHAGLHGTSPSWKKVQYRQIDF